MHEVCSRGVIFIHWSFSDMNINMVWLGVLATLSLDCQSISLLFLTIPLVV